MKPFSKCLVITPKHFFADAKKLSPEKVWMMRVNLVSILKQFSRTVMRRQAIKAMGAVMQHCGPQWWYHLNFSLLLISSTIARIKAEKDTVPRLRWANRVEK